MNLAAFAKWAIQNGPFEGSDLDGYDVQMKAAEFGLLTETKYDPALHGEPISDWIEPGDVFHVFSDEFNAALKTAE